MYNVVLKVDQETARKQFYDDIPVKLGDTVVGVGTIQARSFYVTGDCEIEAEIHIAPAHESIVAPKVMSSGIGILEPVFKE